MCTPPAHNILHAIELVSDTPCRTFALKTETGYRFAPIVLALPVRNILHAIELVGDTPSRG
eukprot:1824594-Prymnesium_polylepis.1